MVYAILIASGLMFGSFLNVCIYRMPKGESVVMPGSHCTKCGHMLPWFENIPVLSFIFLRGKCSKCNAGISFVYPVVEIISAVLIVLMYVYFGLTLKALIYYLLFAALVISSFVDFDIQEIPDIISLPGIVIGLVISFVYPEIFPWAETRWQSLIQSLLGVLVGGGSLYVLGFLGELVFRKEAMGGGDIKLLAMVGAFIGWKLALAVFFIAPFFGVLAGLVVKLRDGKNLIPYGPYLSLGSLIALLWGDKIIVFLGITRYLNCF